MGGSNSGFAAMVKTEAGRIRQRELASRGGRRAHEKGTAHEWTAEDGRALAHKYGFGAQKKRQARRADQEV